MRTSSVTLSWPCFPLKNLVVDGDKINYGVVQPGKHVDNGIPLVRAGDISKHPISIENLKRIHSTTEKKHKKSRLIGDEILLVCVGSIGSVGLSNKDLIGANIARAIARIRCSEKIDKKFLYWYLKSPISQRYFSSQTRTVAQPTLNIREIEQLTIPLPPLAEQKRIAGILDAADALRVKRRDAIASLDTLLQSTFLTLFGDPVTNPMGWDRNTLGDSVVVQGGFAFKSKDYCEDGIRLVKISNVHSGNLKWDEINYVPRNHLDKYRDFSLEIGDVIIALTRPIIKSLDSVKIATVGEQDSPSLLNQRVARFIFSPNSNITKTYLLALCRTIFFKNLVQKFCSESLQPNMSTKQLSNVMIPCPPLKLQHKFAQIDMAIKKQHAQQRAYLAELDTLFASLQSRAFKGEL